MGKRIISQRRGRGSPAFKAPSHRYKVKLSYRTYDDIERSNILKGEVMGFVDDPGHDALLMKILFENNEEGVFLAPEGIKLGDNIYTGANSPVGLGNILPLKNVPEGYYIYNLEIKPGQNGKFVRSPGSYATVVSKEGGKVVVRMPSNKKLPFDENCRVSIGVVSGGGRLEKPLFKAGNSFHKKRATNRRWPIVKGVSMNSVSHPFGGKSHTPKRSTISRNAPPGKKVGHIAARRTGRKKR
ncbi:50S ribosomal protein L2 [Candidatus Micrarchaeota archaeon]|nr:50S ribosomal protein L2 [Candidatus Micrarchaeota archaeon]